MLPFLNYSSLLRRGFPLFLQEYPSESLVLLLMRHSDGSGPGVMLSSDVFTPACHCGAACLSSLWAVFQGQLGSAHL